MTRPTLESLADIAEIESLKSRYCRMIDSKEWSRLFELFEADARFEGFSGTALNPTEFVDRIAKLLSRAITVHHLHHHEINVVNTTEATGVWAMHDYNEWPEPGVLRALPNATGFNGYGFYEERYRRTDKWRFSLMRLSRIRVDPIVRTSGDDILPFEAKGLIAPNVDWMDI